MRKFWLTNADDVVFSLNGENTSNTLTFLNEPSGLGYSVDISTVKLGNTDMIVSETYNLGSVEGDVLFIGKLADVYQQYSNFLAFLAKRPITLHYLPPNTNDSYNCLVRVVSLEKSEVSSKDRILHCPIQMYRQGMWYNDTPNILDASNDVVDGKSYPLTRPYSYGSASLKNISLSNTGMTDTSLKIEIFGSCTDPSWSLFDEENNQYGSAKILGSYDYVKVDSDDLNEMIQLERGGSVIANAINYQDLTVGSPQQVYVTFLKLKSGTSTLLFNLDDNFNGYVRVTWRNAYVSV